MVICDCTPMKVDWEIDSGQELTESSYDGSQTVFHSGHSTTRHEY